MVDFGGEWSSQDACHPSGREKPQHGETQLSSAYEIAIGVAARQHHTEHHGGPAIVTSRNGRYLVSLLIIIIIIFVY